jgi:hypothetical protein
VAAAVAKQRQHSVAENRLDRNNLPPNMIYNLLLSNFKKITIEIAVIFPLFLKTVTSDPTLLL